MPRPQSAYTWPVLMLIVWCYCASSVAGQCIMEDQPEFSGADVLSSPVPGPTNFDECKTYCLQNDDCVAVEFRSVCLRWTSNPMEFASAGRTISLKDCTSDVTTTSSIDVQPTPTTLSEQMTSSSSTAISTGQCLMEDKVDFAGADVLSSPIPGQGNFDECKDYCLQKDDCVAVEFRSVCLEWTADPQEFSSPGRIISLKECISDVTTTSSIVLQTSTTSVSVQMTSSLSSAISTATIVCAHGVTEITGSVDYLELDGGPSFAVNAFTEQGWTSITAGGDTLSIRYTGDSDRDLQQLSFVVKNGRDSQPSVVIETSPGQFDVQEVLDVESDEQTFVLNFDTPFVSIAITTDATISNLVIRVCSENPGTSSTPFIQTSVATQVIDTTMVSIMSSTSLDLISPTATASASATTIPSSCTMIEMADTDVHNTATEYTLEGNAACVTLCQHTVQCQHIVYVDDISTCKLYVTPSITSFYQVNHALLSKRSCVSGEPCCFDIDTNADTMDTAALTLSPTADACKEFCMAFDDCQASAFDGKTCKIVDTPARTLSRENVVLFMKQCPSNVQSPFTRTDVCSGGAKLHPNQMMAVISAGSIIIGYLCSIH